MDSNAVGRCGLRKDRQEHRHTGVDIDLVVGLGLVHVVSDTALERGTPLAGLLLAERPEVIATVSSKVVPLYIKRNQ